jgi:hypothetical protein
MPRFEMYLDHEDYRIEMDIYDDHLEGPRARATAGPLLKAIVAGVKAAGGTVRSVETMPVYTEFNEVEL